MIAIKYVYLSLLLLLLLVFILLFRNIINKHHDKNTISIFGVSLDSSLGLVLFIVLNVGLIFLLYYGMLALSNLL